MRPALIVSSLKKTPKNPIIMMISLPILWYIPISEMLKICVTQKNKQKNMCNTDATWLVIMPFYQWNPGLYHQASLKSDHHGPFPSS